MNIRIILVSIIIAIIIVLGSAIFSQQQVESNNKFQINEERFENMEWNTEITEKLPTQMELGEDWKLLWSDSTETFVEGENPIIFRKTVAGNEILLTSYSYSHESFGTYQILIWKGEMVSNWIPKEAIENIFHQTDAKTEKIFDGLDLIPNCLVAYYDYYGEEKEFKNNLLFSECAKEDFRVRVNLVEGEFSESAIEKIVFLSNSVMGKI